ncbi:ATP-dependent helicase [Alteromonas aestuariivivens]|uniref:ATP-dependent helicase n=1 Tax=Alteromonas aestuariivivens TaxID=1938339 RepID=A0A3D8M8S1_9ALTE|nr:DEAD/DEAH box helicase [Alteromonas aestuariivivens]RDV26006.1 ATP-dependent helicase [Alteromonas aestuariivivens]
MQIQDLPVHHKIITRLADRGLENLTEIQQQTILPALQGKDIIASSKTGSGKTLAFLIPAVHRLMTTKALSRQDPRALILAPTRELAKQVFQEVKNLIARQGLQATLILGGENFNDQAKALARSPHIVVGTAGRIADHLKDKSFYLNGLELLIFDEADRMMDLGFASELNLINQYADHRKRQTMLFSATLDNLELEHFSRELLKSPVRVAIGSAAEQHQDIEQSLYFADNVEHKDELLQVLLDAHSFNQAIVFTATREDTDRITAALNQQHREAIALRGDLPQNQRAQIMSAFGRGQYSILVTTDVASRGLDLLKVGLVINFDLPKQADEYIHRIGRTGRAGQHGIAISLVGPRDWKSYLAIKSRVAYPMECQPLEQSPAKFSGKVAKKRVKNEVGSDADAATAKSNDSAPVRPTPKRVKTMLGTEAGNLPIIRRKRELKADDEEE